MVEGTLTAQLAAQAHWRLNTGQTHKDLSLSLSLIAPSAAANAHAQMRAHAVNSHNTRAALVAPRTVEFASIHSHPPLIHSRGTNTLASLQTWRGQRQRQSGCEFAQRATHLSAVGETFVR